MLIDKQMEYVKTALLSCKCHVIALERKVHYLAYIKANVFVCNKMHEKEKWFIVLCFTYLDIDECTSSPCLDGTCTDLVNSFECQCEEGWTGEVCDMSKNIYQNHLTINKSILVSIKWFLANIQRSKKSKFAETLIPNKIISILY